MNKLCECGCGDPVNNPAARFINGHNSRGVKRDISVALKRKKTCQERYGVDSVTQLQWMKDKSKITSLKKHGVENPAQSEVVKEKIKQSCIDNLGVEYPLQSREVQNQYKQNYLKNHGVNHPSQSEEIKELKRQTCFKNHGVNYPGQSIDVKKKAQMTCLKNHGVENPSQSDEIRKKIKQTYLKNYGVDHPSKSEEIKNKKKQTNIDHYGVDNWAKTDEGRKFHRITAIKCIETQKLNGEPIMPRVGYKERPFLDELQKHTNYKILRQDPRFKYVIGRTPDGYIEGLKLVILYDELHHFTDKECTIYNEVTLVETKDYNSLDDHTLFRISEMNWKKNKGKIINQFKQLIGDNDAK